VNILVCIKQVPSTSNVEIDQETGILKRDGIESKMNPYDLNAIETALRIREKLGGEITVVTMGPPQAAAVIKEAYMLGVDKGYVFSDKRFAGADVLATSYTLFQGIETLGKFKLFLCGKQTTDGDTAQVGPALAEHLGIPHVTWVRTIEEITEEKIVVEQDLADSYEMVELGYPCLITIEKGDLQPRLPSYKKKLETAGRPIKILGLDDFVDQDEKKYGLSGSPTRVERIFPPETSGDRILWEDEPENLAENMYEVLREKRVL